MQTSDLLQIIAFFWKNREMIFFCPSFYETKKLCIRSSKTSPPSDCSSRIRGSFSSRAIQDTHSQSAGFFTMKINSYSVPQRAIQIILSLFFFNCNSHSEENNLYIIVIIIIIIKYRNASYLLVLCHFF